MSALQWVDECGLGTHFHAAAPLPSAVRAVHLSGPWAGDGDDETEERWELDMLATVGNVHRWCDSRDEAEATAARWTDDPYTAVRDEGSWDVDVPRRGAPDLTCRLWREGDGWCASEGYPRCPVASWPTPRLAYIELVRAQARAGHAIDWRAVHVEAREISEHPALARFERTTAARAVLP